INWKTGKPNARYWTLKLLHDNFASGDTLLESKMENDSNSVVISQGFKTKSGEKILIINKRNKNATVMLPASCKGKKLNVVDVSTGDNEPAMSIINSEAIELKPFAVAVIGN